jgi:hypothetical protein
MFDKLSEELKAARIRAGITLPQLANKTRIDLKFLEYFEDGNFSFLPELYVKAFLKEYVKFVGLDEKLILKKYESYKQGKEYIEPPQETLIDKIKEIRFEKEKEREKENPYSKSIPYKPPISPAEPKNPLGAFFMDRRNVMILSSVLAILILLSVAYFFLIKKNSDIIIEKPYEELVNESKERYIENEQVKTPVDSLGNTIDKSDTLKLLITASDSCWVKALIDSSKKEEFKLYPNYSKLITAISNFRITFGNAYRVQLKLNDKPLNLDVRNKVSIVYIDSNGLSFINPVPKQKQ